MRRWSGRAMPARWRCSGRRRRRSRPGGTRPRAAIDSCGCGSGSTIGRWPRCAPSTCATCWRTEGPDVVLSQPLREALQACLSRREQAMVLLNRRGYAPSLLCRGCGNTAECPNCAVTLTVHRRAAQVRCHYCGYAAPLPETCPSCQGEFLEYTGRRHRTRRAGGAGDVSGGARGARRSRHDAASRRHRHGAGAVCRPRDRRAGRHADDRQGPRLPAGDAGRRGLGRHRPRRGRLPRRGAHVPVADAGGRARRPRRRCAARRSCRRCIRSTTRSGWRRGRPTTSSSGTNWSSASACAIRPGSR